MARKFQVDNQNENQNDSQSNDATSSALSKNRIQLKSNLSSMDTYHISPIALFVFLVLVVGDAYAAVMMTQNGIPDNTILEIFLPVLLVAFYLLFAIKIARQWEKAVVLRMGKMLGLKGPGLFWIVPILDSVSNWIDQRVTWMRCCSGWSGTPKRPLLKWRTTVTPSPGLRRPHCERSSVR
jgi:hypothetical protein